MFETKGKKAKELLAYYQAKLDEEARQAKAEGRLVLLVSFGSSSGNVRGYGHSDGISRNTRRRYRSEKGRA